MIDFAAEVMKNSMYQRIMEEIEALETDRIYCKHGMAHVMDVCRLAWILYLEDQLGQQGVGIPAREQIRQRIFVVGLLHDIGRACQYNTGEHHAAAGAVLAEEILSQIDYPQEWRQEAVEIIRAHCGRRGCTEKTVGDYIYRADHLSRPCFCCKAADGCKWLPEERNERLQ